MPAGILSPLEVWWLMFTFPLRAMLVGVGDEPVPVPVGQVRDARGRFVKRRA